MADPKQLKQKHDQWKLCSNEYDFFRESYIGGKVYLNSANLFTHALENKEDFKDRQKKAYYPNFCKPIINIYNSFIFKKDVTRETELDSDGKYQQFVMNADRMGNSYPEVIKDFSRWASVYGVMYGLMDKPAAREVPEASNYPYLVKIPPQRLTNWGLDKFGNLNWVVIKEDPADPESFDDTVADSEFYRVWTKTMWQLYEITKDKNGEEKAALVGEGTHDIGQVPIVVFVDSEIHKMRGLSLIEDIAYINRSIFNWCSLLDEIIYKQTFSQLAIPVMDQSEIDGHEKAMGTSVALFFNANGSGKPEYISPDPQQAEVIADRIEEWIERIYQIATIESSTGVTERSSGVARSFDFMMMNNTLSDKAQNLEDAEKKIHLLWARWQGRDIDEPTISYARDFDIESLNDEIERAIKLQSMRMGDRFNQELKTRIAKRILPRTSADVMAEIEQQIEAMRGRPDTDEEQNAFRSILRNRQGNNQVE